jgi:hypothetical protein
MSRRLAGGSNNAPSRKAEHFRTEAPALPAPERNGRV